MSSATNDDALAQQLAQLSVGDQKSLPAVTPAHAVHVPVPIASSSGTAAGPAPPAAVATATATAPDVKSAPASKEKEKVDEGFLKSPTASDVAVLLVDASGSTSQPFDHKDADKKRTIFDRFEKVATQLPHRRFYVLYWNSNQESSKFGSIGNRGVLKFEYLIAKEKLHQNFELTSKSITNGCLTFPHLAFENLGDWTKSVPMVYFLTDGEIGYSDISKSDLTVLKQKLVEQIKRLIDKNPDVQLNIVTVESKERDFHGEKALEGLPGCDVYEVLSQNGLTQSLSSFASFTPNCLAGYTHLKRVRAPPGFVPFGDRYFSEKDTAVFVGFVRRHIGDHERDEERLLTVLQELSGTISVMAKDKPEQRRNALVSLFSGMFSGTEVDPVMARFILNSAVEKESVGSAALKADYRAQLKDLFKNADKMLLKDVRAATGVGAQFVSFPLTGKNIVVVGPADILSNSVVIRGRTFHNAAANVDGKLVPAVPLKQSFFSAGDKQTTMSEQCVRQWVRSYCGQLYNVDPMSEAPIYHTLGTLVQLFFSPTIANDVVNCFRQLSLTMLRKKRSNAVNVTELDVIVTGKLPIPNSGDPSGLTAGLTAVATRLGLALKPYTLWFLMCCALDPAIADKQKPHCEKELLSNYPTLHQTCDSDPTAASFLPALKQLVKLPAESVAHQHSVSFASILETACLITMDDLKAEGGVMFLPHGESGCRPRQMLSKRGLEMLLNNPATALCPVCYAALDRNSFAAVSAKEIDPTNTDYKSPFAADSSTGFSNHGASASHSAGDRDSKSQPDQKDQKSATSAGASVFGGAVSPANGVLVVLKGTVGGGKTTYTEGVKAYCEQKGYGFHSANTDQYAKDGMDMGSAVARVSNELRAFVGEQASGNKHHVIVVDTCGDRSNPSNIFGSNLAGYRSVTVYPNIRDVNANLADYMSWSLSNVLSRAKCDNKSNFWLNPVGAGCQKCIQVHRAKATAVFGKTANKALPKIKANATTEQALNELSAATNRFKTTLVSPSLAFLDP